MDGTVFGDAIVPYRTACNNVTASVSEAVNHCNFGESRRAWQTRSSRSPSIDVPFSMDSV